MAAASSPVLGQAPSIAPSIPGAQAPSTQAEAFKHLLHAYLQEAKTNPLVAIGQEQAAAQVPPPIDSKTLAEKHDIASPKLKKLIAQIEEIAQDVAQIATILDPIHTAFAYRTRGELADPRLEEKTHFLCDWLKVERDAEERIGCDHARIPLLLQEVSHVEELPRIPEMFKLERLQWLLLILQSTCQEIECKISSPSIKEILEWRKKTVEKLLTLEATEETAENKIGRVVFECQGLLQEIQKRATQSTDLDPKVQLFLKQRQKEVCFFCLQICFTQYLKAKMLEKTEEKPVAVAPETVEANPIVVEKVPNDLGHPQLTEIYVQLSEYLSTLEMPDANGNEIDEELIAEFAKKASLKEPHKVKTEWIKDYWKEVWGYYPNTYKATHNVDQITAATLSLIEDMKLFFESLSKGKKQHQKRSFEEQAERYRRLISSLTIKLEEQFGLLFRDSLNPLTVKVSDNLCGLENILEQTKTMFLLLNQLAVQKELFELQRSLFDNLKTEAPSTSAQSLERSRNFYRTLTLLAIARDKKRESFLHPAWDVSRETVTAIAPQFLALTDAERRVPAAVFAQASLQDLLEKGEQNEGGLPAASLAYLFKVISDVLHCPLDVARQAEGVRVVHALRTKYKEALAISLANVPLLRHLLNEFEVSPKSTPFSLELLEEAQRISFQVHQASVQRDTVAFAEAGQALFNLYLTIDPLTEPFHKLVESLLTQMSKVAATMRYEWPFSQNNRLNELTQQPQFSLEKYRELEEHWVQLDPHLIWRAQCCLVWGTVPKEREGAKVIFNVYLEQMVCEGRSPGHDSDQAPLFYRALLAKALEEGAQAIPLAAKKWLLVPFSAYFDAKTYDSSDSETPLVLFLLAKGEIGKESTPIVRHLLQGKLGGLFQSFMDEWEGFHRETRLQAKIQKLSPQVDQSKENPLSFGKLWQELRDLYTMEKGAHDNFHLFEPVLERMRASKCKWTLPQANFIDSFIFSLQDSDLAGKGQAMVWQALCFLIWGKDRNEQSAAKNIVDVFLEKAVLPKHEENDAVLFYRALLKKCLREGASSIPNFLREWLITPFRDYLEGSPGDDPEADRALYLLAKEEETKSPPHIIRPFLKNKLQGKFADFMRMMEELER